MQVFALLAYCGESAVPMSLVSKFVTTADDAEDLKNIRDFPLLTVHPPASFSDSGT